MGGHWPLWVLEFQAAEIGKGQTMEGRSPAPQGEVLLILYLQHN
jgi:hypothetical protein